MLLADLVVLWIGGLFLLGIIGFFVMAATFVVRFFAFIFRALFGCPEQAAGGMLTSAGRRRVCPHRRCGQLNPPTARYCGRCGRALRMAYDVDAYG